MTKSGSSSSNNGSHIYPRSGLHSWNSQEEKDKDRKRPTVLIIITTVAQLIGVIWWKTYCGITCCLMVLTTIPTIVITHINLHYLPLLGLSEAAQ